MVVTGDAAFGVPPLTELFDTTAAPVVDVVPSPVVVVVVVDSPDVVVEEPSVVVVEPPPPVVVVVETEAVSITQVKPAGWSATSAVTTIVAFQYLSSLSAAPADGLQQATPMGYESAGTSPGRS